MARFFIQVGDRVSFREGRGVWIGTVSEVGGLNSCGAPTCRVLVDPVLHPERTHSTVVTRREHKLKLLTPDPVADWAKEPKRSNPK